MSSSGRILSRWIPIHDEKSQQWSFRTRPVLVSETAPEVEEWRMTANVGSVGNSIDTTGLRTLMSVRIMVAVRGGARGGRQGVGAIQRRRSPGRQLKSGEQAHLARQERALLGNAERDYARQAVSRALLSELRVDVAEQGVQAALELRQTDDDSNPNDGGDEAILDGSRARCVLSKANEHRLHYSSPVS